MLNKKNLLYVTLALIATVGILNADGLFEDVLQLPGRAVESAGMVVNKTGELVEDTNIPVVQQAGTVVKKTGEGVENLGSALAGDRRYNNGDDSQGYDEENVIIDQAGYDDDAE